MTCPITDAIEQGATFTFDYQAIINFLTKKRKELNNSLTQKSEALANLATQESALKKEIDELKDRKLLSDKVAEVKAAIKNHKIVNQLNPKSSDKDGSLK